MKRLLFGYVIGLALGSVILAQTTTTENSRESAFLEGGSVRLQLSSGDYTVRPGNNDRVMLRWRAEDTEHEKDMRKIKVNVDVSGAVARIRTDGPTNYARFIIEVPTRSDLYLRMRAGDLTIVGIEGNKDIRLTAGDVKIDLLPAAYSRVHAAVTFGDLRARPLGISKSSIANSFDWNGSGKYRLNASLFAGDLTLGRD